MKETRWQPTTRTPDFYDVSQWSNGVPQKGDKALLRHGDCASDICGENRVVGVTFVWPKERI